MLSTTMGRRRCISWRFRRVCDGGWVGVGWVSHNHTWKPPSTLSRMGSGELEKRVLENHPLPVRVCSFTCSQGS